MSKLRAILKPEDHARAGRLVLCWLDGNKASADLVLAEADLEPGGLAGLLFALADFNSTLLLMLSGTVENAKQAVELAVQSYLDAEIGNEPEDLGEQPGPEDLPLV